VGRGCLVWDFAAAIPQARACRVDGFIPSIPSSPEANRSICVAPFYIARLAYIGRRLAVAVRDLWDYIIRAIPPVIMASTSARVML
jgi:hypothetical protein